MASLKLYFAIIEDGLVQFSVHRDLSTLEAAWNEIDSTNCVGLIHMGFIKPKIKNVDELLKHRGNIVVSIAAKWALPVNYKSSVSVVAEINSTSQKIPLHLLMTGLGFDKPEPVEIFNSTSITNNKGLTIAEAALSVLNDVDKPLNKEEIFAKIIEADLYTFGVKKPVSMLAVELNRYSIGVDGNNPINEPLFNKIDGERFSSITNTSAALKGWLKQLSIDNNELSVIAGSYGIYDDDSYDVYSDILSDKVRNDLEAYRFFSLYKKIDENDPIALIKILPTEISSANINYLDLPVRVSNVLKRRSIKSLNNLRDISVNDMLKWPNFGRKSIKDLCECLFLRTAKMNNEADLAELVSIHSEHQKDIAEDRDSKNSNVEFQIKRAALIPLKTHFEIALSNLNDDHRKIIESRTGYTGATMTLEAVGEVIGVTRERIRQIQRKCVKKIIETEFWDDCIAMKIGQLLIDRDTPLYIEMLELEDSWFKGFMGNYQHLVEIIELFSENEIRVIDVNGAKVVTRIKLDAWDRCVRNFRLSLKHKAEEGGWSRRDTGVTFYSSLSENGAAELVPLMWNQFEDTLQFDGEGPESKLIGFGKTAEAAVSVVLAKAEAPLHYSEIATRASEIFGKKVNERLAHNASPRLGAKLYGRGIYGLAHHNPIPTRMCKNIQLIVANIIQNGPLMKQWHCAEIIKKLKEQFPSLPKELDLYVLNIILDDVENIEYLNRMVWARTDSGQTKNDRVDVADAFTKILEDHGAPLKGKVLKNKLQDIRGVDEKLQIQPNEKMIQVGPDYWGLIDRDIGGNEEENLESLEHIYSYLKKHQKGIHVSEAGKIVSVSENSLLSPSAYALFNLAQRDDRFYLGRSMFLGLTDWGGDTRRLNISEAVRVVLSEMASPMSIAEINARVEDLIEMPVDNTVTGILINEGAVYNQGLRAWSKPDSMNI